MQKILKTFRLSEEAIDLVARAADETGLSQADVIENCIVNQVGAVTVQEKARRNSMRTGTLAGLQKRERLPRSDAGKARKSPRAAKATAGLNEMQRS